MFTDVCFVLGVNRRSSEAFRLNEKECIKIAVLTKGEEQEIIFINEPNLYRIIFRSNKANAVEFQNWVFEEVLPQIRKTGQYQLEQKQLTLPEPEKTYSFEFTEYELEQLVWLWCSHKQMNNLLGEMITPLEAIGSRFEPIVYSHHHEYKRHYTETTDTIKRLIAPFEYSHRMNWTRAINLINR